MNYFNHSKKDIRSLTLFYKFCTILAVVPCYTFDESHKSHPLWKKLQGLFLISTITAGTAYSMYVRHTSYKEIYTTTHMVLDYLDEFFVVTLAFTVIINSCFFNMKSWIKLNNNLQHIDEILKNKNIVEKNFVSNVSIQFLCYLSLYVCGVIFLLCTWFQEMGVVTIKAYAMHQFCYIYDVLIHFLVYAFSSAIKCRYDDVNKILESEGNDYYEKKVLISLRKIGNMTQCLSETVDLFNNVFGTALIFITGKSMVQLLTCLNFLTNNLKIEDTHFKQKIFIANVILVVYTLISISYIMITSDSANVSSRTTSSLCYKLQEHFVTKSEARNELFKLAQETTANVAVITAANYFQINKATLFGIFSTTTTYFIIVLQFNQSLTGK